METMLLGSVAALFVAKEIREIKLDQNSNVASISGDLKTVLEKLVAGYVSLAGESVKSPLRDIL